MNLKNLIANEIDEIDNVKSEHQNELKKLRDDIKELKLELSAQKLLLKKMSLEFQKQTPFPWMDMAETMKTLNIAERTVHNYIQKGILGRSWLGGKMYFNRKKIEKLLQENYARMEIKK
jgi:hypothetical protein